MNGFGLQYLSNSYEMNRKAIQWDTKAEQNEVSFSVLLIFGGLMYPSRTLEAIHCVMDFSINHYIHIKGVTVNILWYSLVRICTKQTLFYPPHVQYLKVH